MSNQRRTDLILHPTRQGRASELSPLLVSIPSLLAPWDRADSQSQILSWSWAKFDPFSPTPTILEALNRLRVIAGFAPLATRPDGTIDLSEDPIQFALNSGSTPFVS
jgi:hypothetical protein